MYTFFFSSFADLIRGRPAVSLAVFFSANFSFFFAVFSEVLRCLLRNFGKKRSHDSVANAGSFASSRLIMSS